MAVLVPADMVRTHVAGADAPANVSVVLRRATWTVENFEESRRAWELPSWPLDDTMRQSGTYAEDNWPGSYTDMLKLERRDSETFIEECIELNLYYNLFNSALHRALHTQPLQPMLVLYYQMRAEMLLGLFEVATVARSRMRTVATLSRGAGGIRAAAWKLPPDLLIKNLAKAIARGRLINRYLQRIEDEADSADSVFWASSTEETVVF